MNVIDEINLEQMQAALLNLAEQVASGTETLKQFQIFFVNAAPDGATLAEMQKINRHNAQRLNCTIHPLTFLQLLAYQNIMLKASDNLHYYQEVTNAGLARG